MGIKKFASDTLFFLTESRKFMQGIRTTPIQWVKAYINFMKLSRNY